jgi:glycine oxidase
MTRRTRSADAIVVGGGVVGCSVAYALARERLSVVLLEADDIASGASGAAAGMLAPVSEAASPGPLLRLGLSSLALFPALVAEVRELSGIDPELERSGCLRIASSEVEAAAFRARDRSLPSLDLEWLDAEAARRLEPSLAPDIHGALFSPHESHVRSPIFSRALAMAAAALGADLRLGMPVRGLLRQGARVYGVDTAAGWIEASHVVLCTGIDAAQSPAWLGRTDPLPIVPVRGQILSLAPRPPGLRTIVWSGSTYLVPKRDGSVVVGATEERAVFDRRVTAAGVSQLLAEAIRLIPAFDDAAFTGAWAGLRPATPDQLPLVGPWPGIDGLLLAAGHYRNGVLLAPLTAQLIVGLVLGKGLPEEAAPLLPERFPALHG